MRTPRLIVGLATAGLLAVSPLAVTAAPASAAATVGSAVSVDALADDSVIYGDDLYFSGQVTMPNGETPDNGTVSLQVSTPKNPTYTTIATDDSPYFSFSDIKAIGNATYQIVYAGGTAYNYTTSSTDTVTGSVSVPVGVTAERKVKLHTDGLKVIGKVNPKYKKKKVKILAVHGKKKSKYTVVKTSKKGKFVFRAPNRIGFRFIVVIPASSSFAGTKAKYHVI